MDITNNNPSFFGYTNPTEVNRQEISYTTYNYINPENYFNQHIMKISLILMILNICLKLMKLAIIILISFQK